MMKNLNLAKIILIIVIIFGIYGVYYLAFNENDIKNQENFLEIREENIKEISKVYKENFQTIGITESAIIIEHEENSEGIDIRKDYFVFGEDGKSLIKIKYYEGTNENNTPILKKEIYIDLSQKVEGSTNLYNGVTEIYIEDWSSKVIDNYEFKTPIEKITEMLNKRYDFDNADKEIALNLENEVYVNKWEHLNHRSYGWIYEIKENNKDEYLSFSMGNEERSIYFNFEIYEDNKIVKKISIQGSKQKGSIDDVTVPEL